MSATVNTADAPPILCPAEGQIASIPASMCARRLRRGVKCWEGSMKSLLLANSHARGFDAHARRRRISARARDRRASIALPHRTLLQWLRSCGLVGRRLGLGSRARFLYVDWGCPANLVQPCLER